MINFVNPDVLGSYQEFKTRFETPILQSQQQSVLKEYRELGAQRKQELHEITSKFILRRTQEIINRYLPKKQELVIFVKPSVLQKKLTVDLLEIYKQKKGETLLAKNLLPLEMIISLKKVCNHPSLLQCNDSEREKGISRLLDTKIPKVKNKLFKYII